MFIDRFDEAVCGCCGRRSHGIAWSPGPNKRLMWLCDDEACIRAAQETYFMKQKQFDAIEEQALRDGGAEGGQYLENIGKADFFRHITEPEWNEFLRRIAGGYRSRLLAGLLEARKRDASGGAPF